MWEDCKGKKEESRDPLRTKRTKRTNSDSEAVFKGVDPWPPRPAELAGWPIEWRERWGRLANQLEEEGVPFPESERAAFGVVKAERAERRVG
jgi:hypothetical protein